MATWDHGSHEQFYDYYAEASQTETARRRFRSVRDSVLRIIAARRPVIPPLQVADIGCGAGTQSMMWAELGHQVHGLDVNRPLLELAKERAAEASYNVDFRVGSATELPWADDTMDVCLALELIEHVAEWKNCLDEFTRVLRPGGVLVLTTTNKLCPVQQEFNLPFYAWYPAPVKRYFERLAVTTHPTLANFAKYPAVNWFSFYSLRARLAAHGLRCLDRFDIMDLSKKSALTKLIVLSARRTPVLRWLAHVATPGTILVGIKKSNPAR